MKKPEQTKKIRNEKEACEIIEHATLDIEALARAFEAVDAAFMVNLMDDESAPSCTESQEIILH